MKKLFACGMFLLGFVTVSLRAAESGIVINELMASNTRAYPDITDFEDYPDWIELKNNGDSAASLDGYFLSDDPSNPLKWAIPAGASIPAKGFLIIVADGHDAAPGETFPRGYWPWKNFVTEKYHANFSLAAAGETHSSSHPASNSGGMEVHRRWERPKHAVARTQL
jgi:hypothetical protein